jgi:hypothetical protein
MSSHQAERAMITLCGRRYQFTPTGPSAHDRALLDELSFVRREAQAEADEAYLEWLAVPCSEAYAVYRAAQDRADAAQDDLARCGRRVGG